MGISHQRMEVHADTRLSNVPRIPGLSMSAPESFAPCTNICIYKAFVFKIFSQQCYTFVSCTYLSLSMYTLYSNTRLLRGIMFMHFGG